MSTGRFANPEVTKRFVLGDCECPGKPHTEDWIDFRTEIGAQDSIKIAIGGNYAALRTLAKRWNLQDDDSGKPAELDEDHFDRLLTGDLWDDLNTWLTENTVESRQPLPNESAAPSESSIGEKPSLTLNPRTGGSSTTSSSPSAAGATTTSGSPPQLS